MNCAALYVDPFNSKNWMYSRWYTVAGTPRSIHSRRILSPQRATKSGSCHSVSSSGSIKVILSEVHEISRSMLANSKTGKWTWGVSSRGYRRDDAVPKQGIRQSNPPSGVSGSHRTQQESRSSKVLSGEPRLTRNQEKANVHERCGYPGVEKIRSIVGERVSAGCGSADRDSSRAEPAQGTELHGKNAPRQTPPLAGPPRSG